MKKLVLVVISIFVFAAVGAAFAEKGPKGLFNAKAGDQIYVCACGESCKCGTLSTKEGNCGCGEKLVEAKVTKIEKGKVFYKIGEKEFSAPQKGKFACACGDCDCGAVSQKAGSCGCDKPMKKVGK